VSRDLVADIGKVVCHAGGLAEPPTLRARIEAGFS
jgi:hypothetical protein